jgi:glycosyltransferase involved in cell wall biosynthesis
VKAITPNSAGIPCADDQQEGAGDRGSAERALPPHFARLLFLESLSTISGGQAVLLDVARELRASYELMALLPGEGPLAEELRGLGVRCNLAPVGRYSLVRKSFGDVLSYAARLPWLTLLTWRLIREERVDLVYANSTPTFIWGTLAATLAGRPVIWHVHNMLADGKSLAMLRIVGRLPIVRRIICVCRAAQDQLPPLAAKSTVIYNGIDTARFQVHPEWGRQVRQELGITADAPVVAIVGDLTSHKGQRLFLRAAQLVGRKLPEARFLIVGKERDTAESRQYVKGLRAFTQGWEPADRVLFTGYRPDMERIMNALDILVVASSAGETTSLVLQEAMACGKVVVGSRVGGIPEMIRDGVTGYLYDIGDDEALAQRLLTALDHGRTAGMGLAAQRFAAERFGLARFHREISSEIERVLLTRRRRRGVVGD